jgi:ectoine hydroxylase-related dioxygenase (phytanoyl-CoA dioxygenase family)
VPTAADLADWCERFHRDGFLVLHNILTTEQVAELKADLATAISKPQPGEQEYQAGLRCRLFENSKANADLFEQEPITTLAEALIAPDCHVVHNNGFSTPSGTRLAPWHQDDAPHFLVTEGEVPKNIHLPVLLFTANYYLTDVSYPEAGPTVVIPGSHRFGRQCPDEPAETPAHACGPAGSVVLFNNQTWHCSGFNSSGRDRMVCQVSYARRLIGHKYYPFMNYQMPEHMYEDASPRRKRLLGFLPTGAYG